MSSFKIKNIYKEIQMETIHKSQANGIICELESFCYTNYI